MGTAARDSVHIKLSQNHMATTFELTASVPREKSALAERALGEAHLEIARLEQELSEYIDSSAVARLNASKPGERVCVSRSVIELLELGAKIEAQTHRAFSMSAKTPNSCPHPRFEWDADLSQAWKTSPEAHLGFGAIGKGYALDRAREILESYGIEDYCLSAGGSSLALNGFSAPFEPWRIGWSWLKDESGQPKGIPLFHHSGARVSIGVSGLHEKGRHILDPRTGKPAERALSALVAEKKTANADALSTALFVSGWKAPLSEEIGAQSDVACAQIDSQGVPRWNRAFQALWGALATLLVSFQALADETVDLSLIEEEFNPYLFERSSWWIALPLFALFMVLIHLKQTRPLRKKTQNPEEMHK